MLSPSLVCNAFCLAAGHVLSGQMQSSVPSTEAVLNLYHLLRDSDTDLRQPVALEQQLMQDNHLDTDVGKSMLQLLQVSVFLVVASLPSRPAYP